MPAAEHNPNPALIYEIDEIVTDLKSDLTGPTSSFGPEAAALFRQCALELYRNDRTPEQIIDDTAKAFAFWTLIGREHALRGYELHLHREGSHTLPDTLDKMFPYS